jgi:hypothetical protein
VTDIAEYLNEKVNIPDLGKKESIRTPVRYKVNLLIIIVVDRFENRKFNHFRLAFLMGLQIGCFLQADIKCFIDRPTKPVIILMARDTQQSEGTGTVIFKFVDPLFQIFSVYFFEKMGDPEVQGKQKTGVSGIKFRRAGFPAPVGQHVAVPPFLWFLTPRRQ